MAKARSLDTLRRELAESTSCERRLAEALQHKEAALERKQGPPRRAAAPLAAPRGASKPPRPSRAERRRRWLASATVPPRAPWCPEGGTATETAASVLEGPRRNGRIRFEDSG